ncbi:VCBS repeat-containing protein [soil metagenome]|jgi:hypothetical protein
MLRNYKLSIKYWVLGAVAAGTVSVGILDGCKSKPATTQDEQQLAEGKALAQKYCVSCHQFPDPSLIDKASWVDGVLPGMATQFKLEHYGVVYIANPKSTISVDDWQSIVNYYKTSAPAKLVQPASPFVSDWAIFSLVRPKNVSHAPKDAANTSLLAFNPIDSQLYSGDAQNRFYRWSSGLKPALIAKMASPVTGVTFLSAATGKNSAVITTIGVIYPSDIMKGKVEQLDLDGGKIGKPVTITDSLPRSVQTAAADFNKDGLMDYVTCGFGHEHGGLYLLTQQADHHYKKHIIRGIPGGEQLITGDFNNDGWPDVMCLFAQADEGIWMFLNDHKGGFSTQNLLHFPPIYGSSSFQLVDFNHDGKPDILYTCGDNSDYSKVLKPYHGVYIFTNQGNWKFKQTYFYHIDGSTKAMAADFDHDGDLDIATIAFFADFKFHPRQGFIYLEQTSAGKFLAHEVPVNDYGRWLTMEVADMDHDGYQDVILGNFSVDGRGLINQKDLKPTWDRFEPLIVLKNVAGSRNKAIKTANSK